MTRGGGTPAREAVDLSGKGGRRVLTEKKRDFAGNKGGRFSKPPHWGGFENRRMGGRKNPTSLPHYNSAQNLDFRASSKEGRGDENAKMHEHRTPPTPAAERPAGAR